MAAHEGSPRLVAQDLVTGEEMLGPELPGVLSFNWTPPAPASFPSALVVSPDSLELAWGQQDTLEATLAGRSGALEMDDIEWEAEDARVAYVGRGGRVVGQGEGTTRVVASALGLLYDTVVVRVRSATPPEALLLDRFETFDTTTWAVVGTLTPESRSVDGRQVLEASGGGVAVHGLLSRRGFDLSRGGTLELTYRLPLTRTDRQSIQLCLLAGDGSRPPVQADGGWVDMGRVCFFHPSGQLSLFDSLSYTLHGQAHMTGYRDPAVLPSDAWHNITLVLAPDGAVRLLIDREEVGSVPAVTANGPALRWHVMIHTRAVDTQLLLRDLVLWEGIRY
jgi:hypothetical protein